MLGDWGGCDAGEKGGGGRDMGEAERRPGTVLRGWLRGWKAPAAAARRAWLMDGGAAARLLWLLAFECKGATQQKVGSI